MRIAIVTDDGVTISPHFGRARLYAVVQVEEGVIVARETREKSAPHAQRAGSDGAHAPGAGGVGSAAEAKHAAMVAPIADCDVVIARGMGGGAHAHIVAAGLQPVITDLRGVEEAALACAQGSIVDHPERLH